jgi:hypothetical protein
MGNGENGTLKAEGGIRNKKGSETQGGMLILSGLFIIFGSSPN